jgi:hypothetical protein
MVSLVRYVAHIGYTRNEFKILVYEPESDSSEDLGTDGTEY